MRLVVPWVTAALTSLLALGCGTDHTVTVTTTETVTAVASSMWGTQPPARDDVARPSKFRRCDANISAKKVTTSCPFAENVFLEYFVSGRADTVAAYSPGRKRYYNLRCTDTHGHVRCRTYTGAIVKFPASAVAAYTSAQALAYTAKADVGPGPRPSLNTHDAVSPEPEVVPQESPAPGPVVPADPAPQDDFCDTHACIPNYDNGNGSTVQCADGSYSQSGGIQGACSHHGGLG